MLIMPPFSDVALRPQGPVSGPVKKIT